MAHILAGSGVPASHDNPSDFGGQYGYYTDLGTGLLLLGHRYYDPGTGRFINRDPIGYSGGVNQYRYAGNNPINDSDLSRFYSLVCTVSRFVCAARASRASQAALVPSSCLMRRPISAAFWAYSGEVSSSRSSASTRA